MSQTNRHLEIDLLRSLALAMMILYHAAFDLSAFWHFPIDPYSGSWLILERITAILFLALVGVSAAISNAQEKTLQARWQRAFRRFAVLLACGALISAATFITAGDAYVRFGVLHLIALSSLLLPFFLPLGAWNALLALIVYFFGITSMGHGDPTGGWLLPLGLHASTFASVDYFPLFPWFSAILAGAALGHLLYVRGWLRQHLPSNKLSRTMAIPGRHSLLIYLLHQPILLALFWITLGRP